MTQSPQDPTPTNRSDLTGTSLGKYRLIERLGQGGMAQVFKAHQPSLDRFVAIKVLHPHLTSDEEFAVRFQHEARAIAVLEHPNIIRVYDFDADRGLAYLVMEYLVGSTLKTRLRGNGENRQIEFSEVARTIAALGDALDYAHARGVLHRDIKPSNVFITSDHRPILIDFGVARMVDATIVTGSGETFGTAAYMSPEQGRGEPADARSDVYSLGILLYQLCTGQLPFQADVPYAIILKHITSPIPSPRTLRPDLPNALERVIRKSLAKRPEERFQTAGELAHAVQTAVEPRAMMLLDSNVPRMLSRIGQVIKIPSRWSLPWKAVGLVMATILLCIGLFFLSIPWRTERYLRGMSTTLLSNTSVSTLPLEGPDAFVDSWLDPDMPDGVWQAVDRAELRGGSKADRILLGINLSKMTLDTTVVSATLGLRVENRNPNVPSGKIVAYRLMTMWRPSTASYNSPWGKPGLAPGVDYDPVTIDRVTLPDDGYVTLNVGQAVAAWQKLGRGGGGLVVMLSEDSDSQSRYSVYLTEHSDPLSRPSLRIFYKANP